MGDDLLPTQCTDNEDEYPGVVVYDDKEFPISSQQDGQDVLEMTASGERQGNHSSVRPFQSARYENDNAATPASLQEEEEDEDEEEEEEEDEEDEDSS